MDLIRLKTYIKERVKESKRLSMWALENQHVSLANAHTHSIKVGEQILKEIDEEIKNHEVR